MGEHSIRAAQHPTPRRDTASFCERNQLSAESTLNAIQTRNIVDLLSASYIFICMLFYKFAKLTSPNLNKQLWSDRKSLMNYSPHNQHTQAIHNNNFTYKVFHNAPARRMLIHQPKQITHKTRIISHLAAHNQKKSDPKNKCSPLLLGEILSCVNSQFSLICLRPSKI